MIKSSRFLERFNEFTIQRCPYAQKLSQKCLRLTVISCVATSTHASINLNHYYTHIKLVFKKSLS